jgi:hypothetical protein
MRGFLSSSGSGPKPKSTLKKTSSIKGAADTTQPAAQPDVRRPSQQLAQRTQPSAGEQAAFSGAVLERGAEPAAPSGRTASAPGPAEREAAPHLAAQAVKPERLKLAARLGADEEETYDEAVRGLVKLVMSNGARPAGAHACT